jgi:colanic acid/amylovoran biosynthesis glycosyltransferase
VLHAHFGPVGNSFRFARDLFGAPLVVSFHGYDFSTVPRKEGSDVYRKLFATADAITANSGFTRENVARLGCPAGKIHHLPVGFDPNEFPFRERSRESDKPVRILTVGRLVEIKGHEYLIRAVARLCERHPHIRCDIAGDGPLRKKLEELVGQLALRQSAVFHGPVGSVAVRQLMQDAHLFVLPSVNIEGDQEGQGLALQEAQASGLPVIATEHGALPEGMLPGESGLLVPERDVDALAEKLSFLIEHPELWPEFGRKGRAFVEARYDIRDLSRRLVEIYEGAIGSFRSTRDGRC